MSEQDFFERLQQNPRPVVVDFWAPWCGPCRMIEPVLKRLGESYKDRVDIWKVNADEQPELLRKLRIFGIPTLVAFHQGQEVSRRTGSASQETLAALFEAAISGEKPAKTGPAPLDRFLRLLAGSALFVLSMVNDFAGWYLLLAGIGGAIAFSAVYDRCPVYKAVASRLKSWLDKSQTGPTKP
jgi:thioredoxin 1